MRKQRKRRKALRLGRELIAKERDALDVFFANVTPDDGELWIGKRNVFVYESACTLFCIF